MNIPGIEIFLIGVAAIIIFLTIFFYVRRRILASLKKQDFLKNNKGAADFNKNRLENEKLRKGILLNRLR
ncbi:MAG: hypothetical protein K1X72_08170 [Pyrinomonadaceae bacterium]|nr:hypothetical protein [Pyrinomonadaceae bacterium]